MNKSQIVEGEVMTKEEREVKEFKSLFSDKRYAEKAWRKFIEDSLKSDVSILPDFIGPSGNVTPQSEIYQAAIKSVKNRLDAQGITREPMKAEVLIEAAVIRAAFDNTALNVVLDRTAGKVKDEVTINNNPYEDLSDEELDLLITYREAKKLETKKETDDNAES